MKIDSLNKRAVLTILLGIVFFTIFFAILLNDLSYHATSISIFGVSIAIRKIFPGALGVMLLWQSYSYGTRTATSGNIKFLRWFLRSLAILLIILACFPSTEEEAISGISDLYKKHQEEQVRTLGHGQ